MFSNISFLRVFFLWNFIHNGIFFLYITSYFNEPKSENFSLIYEGKGRGGGTEEEGDDHYYFHFNP